MLDKELARFNLNDSRMFKQLSYLLARCSAIQAAKIVEEVLRFHHCLAWNPTINRLDSIQSISVNGNSIQINIEEYEIVLSHNQRTKLLANWGEKSSSMACMAEVRIYDPCSSWECYVYAMNPEDEDQICCLIKGFSVEVAEWRLSELANRFNSEGEFVQMDYEYQPRLASELFKILNQRVR